MCLHTEPKAHCSEAYDVPFYSIKSIIKLIHNFSPHYNVCLYSFSSLSFCFGSVPLNSSFLYCFFPLSLHTVSISVSLVNYSSSSKTEFRIDVFLFLLQETWINDSHYYINSLHPFQSYWIWLRMTYSQFFHHFQHSSYVFSFVVILQSHP